MRKRIISIVGICLTFILAFMAYNHFNHQDIYKTKNNLKLVSRVQGEKLSYYVDGTWHTEFLHGVNLGATTPGHHPGELSPDYNDYLRWFEQMDALGIRVVRVYTILPPYFYTALVDHNKQAREKLWLMQGIWSPEEELIKEQNAYVPDITNKFNEEIFLAVRAVYGQGKINPKPGKASGEYKSNAAPYLLGWMVGSEWDPSMVHNTNYKNPVKNRFEGNYFTNTGQSSPFEAWLAQSLNYLAVLESDQGWQHPVSFVNWVTTDPLTHPNEPFTNEDQVSVDPMHITPTARWQAGYFAAYHVYPYYPDSLRFQKDYQDYINKNGQHEPYEAYLVQLKKHHTGIPIMISEFGVPSSRGMAHRGTLERNQGMHTEKEQGEMLISMFEAIKNASMAGGILFSWQDEWFKHTWNTMDLEIPADRRPMWYNRLTNEENFGLIAVEPGNMTPIHVDGELKDWENIDPPQKAAAGQQFRLNATSDEGYVYLSIEKPSNWNWQNEDLLVAFDNQPGGNEALVNGPVFPFGAEFLLTMKNPDDAVLSVASAYDAYTYLYGRILKMIPFIEDWSRENNGVFLPWKLCLSRELYLPATKEIIPFEGIEIGRLHAGTSNPAAPDYNSLTDYNAGKQVIEFRIPWMMLGFTDPSTHQVWSYPYRQNLDSFTSTSSAGINMTVITVNKTTGQISQQEEVLAYKWSNWDIPTYHERKKQSYQLLEEYLRKAN